MKKLNENVLRRLILETIDEQAGVVTEGKKKKEKLKEAEPVPTESPEDRATAAEQDVAHSKTAADIAANTMNPDVPTFNVAQYMGKFEQINKTIKTLLNDPNDTNRKVAAGLMKELSKELEGNQE